jgi:hypothetical protein
MAQMNKPVVCPRCGSQHFTRLTFNTFRAGGYGSSDIQEEGAIPTELLVCLCGQAVRPSFTGMTRGTAQKAKEGLTASLNAANTVNTEAHSKVDLKPLLDQVVVPSQLAELAAKVAELEAKLAKLQTSTE